MRVEQRPWVTAEAAVNGPLTYDQNGVTINLLFTLRNTGHSPAIAVYPSPTVAVHGLMVTHHEFAQACKVNDITMGVYVFPGDVVPFPMSVVFDNGDKKFWTKYPTFKPAIAPIVFVCIIYWEPGDDRPHHTPFKYELVRKASNNPKRSPAAIFVDEGNVPADNLGLLHEIFNVPPPD